MVPYRAKKKTNFCEGFVNALLRLVFGPKRVEG